MARTNNSIDKPLDKAPTVKEALMIAEKRSHAAYRIRVNECIGTSI